MSNPRGTIAARQGDKPPLASYDIRPVVCESSVAPVSVFPSDRSVAPFSTNSMTLSISPDQS